jgi:uncharacterized protein (TIGR04255 family)
MKLPKSISPCPIREAVAEVRFTANVPPDAVFGITYQALKSGHAQAEPLPILSLPADLRTKDRDFAHQPHYRLRSEKTVVLVGPQVISVGMQGEYPGWTAHCRSVTDIMARFHDSGIMARTLRLGLRYISFFAFDIYPNLLLKILVDDTSLEGDETFFKTVLSGKGCRSLLQVGKGLALRNKPGEHGSIIDIDSFTTETEGDFMPVLESFLQNAHQTEKELFFRLLKPEFLKTLNPVYDDAE